MTASNKLDDLKCEIESFVESHLPSEPIIPKSEKVVHDGLWGTIRLKRAELALLDTPLLQRLRYIQQTGPANYVYPSARHSRFEHTLGVMLQVQKLGDAILSRRNSDTSQQERNGTPLDVRDVEQMRLGALLHDVGHGVFSHTSELLYGNHPGILAFRNSNGNVGSPHEILSRLIVESAPFKLFADKIAKATNSVIECNDIALAITGKMPRQGGHDYFAAELLNGPFDADKLDYLFRDSHFTGLPLSVDIERLWQTVCIKTIPRDNGRHLAITHSGAGTLEQILFAKMVLYTSVYQHHKIRAMECMFQGAIEYIRRTKASINCRERKLEFNSPVDFLYLTDQAFLYHGYSVEMENPLHKILHGFFFRRPLVRAMVISEHTVQHDYDDSKWDKLIRLDKSNSSTAQGERRNIAKCILEQSGIKADDCLPEQIWLDLPTLPSGTSANDTFVEMPGSDELLTLNEIFPLEKWVEQYGQNKWRGHIFCPADHVKAIGKTGKEYLERTYNITIKDSAFTLCKQQPY